MRISNEERFMSFVQIDNKSGCWLWTGGISKFGYGRFWINGKTIPAHRTSYGLFKGPIDEGYEVDHQCHNEAVKKELCLGGDNCLHRRCVNPDHLRLSTPRDNLIAGNTFIRTNYLKTHCWRGHPFTKNNFKIVNGSRLCLLCKRIDDKRRYLEEKGSGQRKSSDRIITEEDVKYIRESYENGKITQMRLAEQFNVTRANITAIVNGKTWKHDGENFIVKWSVTSNAKLTGDDVKTIRNIIARGTRTQRQLAKEYEISESAISCVVNKKKWKHVPDSPKITRNP